MKSWKNKPLGIVGFGAQAKAWAMNYRDAGYHVAIILRSGSSNHETATQMGFETVAFDSPVLKTLEIICLLTPDDTHKDIINKLKSQIKEQATLIYAHGYSFERDQLAKSYPQYSHLLLAPKAIASEVRFRFETKKNIMAAFSLEAAQDWNEAQIKEFAQNFGFNKLISTSFAEEAKADLFSEQSLLCSLIPYGALHSYNKLREEGVNKQLAFIECWMEVLLIAKAMVEHGPEGLFNLISPNDLIGGEKAVSTLFDDAFLKKLDQMKEDIWSGRFYNHVDETDFTKLKEEVLDFWKNQEIQSVYNNLKDDL